MDPRLKLAALFIFSISSVHAGWQSLLLLTFLILFAIFRLNLSLFAILKEMRYFIFFLILIWFVRILSVQDIEEASLMCWRLMLVAWMGICFMQNTRSSEIRAAVRFFFKPVPFVPEKRLAMMMSLLMRFLPLIHLQIREISDAQKARGIESRKNPIYRTVTFVIPLIRRTFEDADRLVIAMKARSFCEDRSEPELLWTRQDSINFVAVIVFSVIIVLG